MFELSFCPFQQAELTQPKPVLTQLFQSIPTLEHCCRCSLGFEWGPGKNKCRKYFLAWTVGSQEHV